MKYYQIGDVVKLINRNFKVSQELYGVEGYTVSKQFKKGKELVEATYLLKNLENGKMFKASHQYIIKPYSVNELLDLYNDYKILYEWFKDDTYKNEMNEILFELKKVVEYQIYA